MASLRFDLIVAVWGDLFRGLFEKICLPSLCAPQNLAALAERGPTALRLYTPANQVDRLDVMSLRARIPAAVEFQVVTLDGIGRADHMVRNYLDLSACHRHAIGEAANRNAVLVFLPADGVWADGSLPRLADRIASGKRAVFTLGTRVATEAFIDVYAARFLDTQTWRAACPARELVRAALECLHPVTRAAMIDASCFTTWPSTIIWPVAAGGLLVRAFHFHPAFVWPRRYGDFSKTVDLDFVANAVDGRDEIYVVTDSDEALQINLDVESHLPNHIGTAPAEPTAIAAWARENADPLHRWLFAEHPVRLHAGPIDGSWDTLASRSEAFAQALASAIEASGA